MLRGCTPQWPVCKALIIINCIFFQFCFRTIFTTCLCVIFCNSSMCGTQSCPIISSIMFTLQPLCLLFLLTNPFLYLVRHQFKHQLDFISINASVIHFDVDISGTPLDRSKRYVWYVAFFKHQLNNIRVTASVLHFAVDISDTDIQTLARKLNLFPPPNLYPSKHYMLQLLVASVALRDGQCERYTITV